MSEIDIFISYKSERRKAAEHLATVLSYYGYSVWFDYQLIKGSDFGFQIDRRIRDAKALVALWCSLSVGSRWVIEEVDLAHERGILIPVKIEACELPVGFRRLDYIDLSSWDGAPRSHQLDRLIEALEQRIGRPAHLDLKGVREYEAMWRRFGAPSLKAFALGKPLADVEGDRRIPWLTTRPPKANPRSPPEEREAHERKSQERKQEEQFRKEGRIPVVVGGRTKNQTRSAVFPILALLLAAGIGALLILQPGPDTASVSPDAGQPVAPSSAPISSARIWKSGSSESWAAVSMPGTLKPYRSLKDVEHIALTAFPEKLREALAARSRAVGVLPLQFDVKDMNDVIKFVNLCSEISWQQFSEAQNERIRRAGTGSNGPVFDRYKSCWIPTTSPGIRLNNKNAIESSARRLLVALQLRDDNARTPYDVIIEYEKDDEADKDIKFTNSPGVQTDQLREKYYEVYGVAHFVIRAS